MQRFFLAAFGLSCGMRDLSLRCVGFLSSCGVQVFSLAVACGLCSRGTQAL